MKFHSLFAALVLLAGSGAWAQTAAAAHANDPTATPRLDRREANQQKRIDQGVASGQLTTKEAALLEKRDDRLESHEAKAKADGKVTANERRRLEREADHNSKAIYRLKHNKKTAATASK